MSDLQQPKLRHMLTSTGMFTTVMMVVRAADMKLTCWAKVMASRKHFTTIRIYCISPSMSIWMVVSIHAILMVITYIVEKGLA